MSGAKTGVSSVLIDQWTKYQQDIAQRAVYEDRLSFRVTAQAHSRVDGISGLDTAAHDWDEPLASRIDLASVRVEGLKLVGGMDISLRRNGTGEEENDAVASLVILDYPSLKLRHTFLRPVRLSQPYVPSFLAMRECEHLCAVYDEAQASLPSDEMPQIIFVDGFGRWHERQAGLATVFGVERGVPTIGVGKEYNVLRPGHDPIKEAKDDPSPLPSSPGSEHWRYGQRSFKERVKAILKARGEFTAIPLYADGPLVGAAVTTARTTTPRQSLPSPLPSYISPGHLISLSSSLALSLVCCKTPGSRGGRQPEPIILADKLSRDEVKRLWG